MEKIKALKSKIKVWNREVFGMVESNKLESLKKLKFWGDIEELRPLSPAEINQRLFSPGVKNQKNYYSKRDKNTCFFFLLNDKFSNKKKSN